MDHSHIKKILRAGQRQILLNITGAYRATSFAALTAVTGAVPIEMKLKELAKRREIRKGRREGTRGDVAEEVLRAWHAEWDNGQHGRYTMGLLPDLEERSHLKYLIPDFWSVQLLTGHKAFKSYLYKHDTVDDPLCDDCRSEEDTPEHVLFHCPAWEEIRIQIYKAATEEGLIQPITLGDCLLSARVWSSVTTSWREIHRMRAL